MVEVYAVKLDKKLDEPKFNEIMTYLSPEKREKIRKFHRVEDAKRALLGDILVRHLICTKLKIRNEQLIFSQNEYGKPFLINSNDIQYNVSHSGSWVVCAIDNLPVGIDIEFQQQINFDIAKRFFSKDEYNDLMSKNESDRPGYFYCLWTFKESYIKAAGKGLSIPLDSFSIKEIGADIKIDTLNNFKDCFFKKCNIDDNYKMAVCALNNSFIEEVKIKDVEELCLFL
jgi:4'-phosphopantetheinyl transferase